MPAKPVVGAAAKNEPNETGPSGFIEMQQGMLVVDHGKIFLDSSQVGFLYEDGLLKGMGPPFATGAVKAIEEIPGATFRGIDTSGSVLQYPTEKRGPTGLLKYNNNVSLPVLNGRIATAAHRVVGTFDDRGKMFLRDHKDSQLIHELDEYTQLTTFFQGLNSKGEPFSCEYVRPLHKRDRSYVDNEIMRYFEDFDRLTTAQKGYVLDQMKLWAASGVLQIIRRSEGDAALGTTRHGASGVTGVRTGKVTISSDDFEDEIRLYKQFGPVATCATQWRPYYEVRVNLVVAHEFGHQLEFCLSQSSQDSIEKFFFDDRLPKCNRMHPAPKGYEGASELLLVHQIEERVFVSGYSRVSFHEYWAECVAAFSIKGSREMLKKMDPGIYKILEDIVLNPEKSLSRKFEIDSRKLQTSLRVGGELKDDLLV